MKSRVDILVGLPSKENDVKVLATIENLKRVGLYIMQDPNFRSESSYEDVDPLVEVSSLARLPGPVVIREPDAVAVPVASSPVVHGKGKNIRIPLPSPPSSDDEDLTHIRPPYIYVL